MGCEGTLRAPVGADGITSPKGLSLLGRLSAPVFHFRRLSCTRPSIGSRKRSHGSQFERGITLTSGNSAWAALGRSPPRMVVVSRMISPRRSRPARASAPATMKERRGEEATKTCAPGTSLGRSFRPHS